MQSAFEFTPSSRVLAAPGETAWFIPCLPDQRLYCADAQWQPLRADGVKHLLVDGQTYTSIGTFNGDPCFIFAVDRTIQSALSDEYKVGLRDLLFRQDSERFYLASLACQIAGWELTHRFCGSCGEPMERDPNEFMRFCTPCNVHHYPRISPCIIVLVTDGERLLLARGVRHASIFSTLAGFIEPGETAEQAVHREVKEEVGVELGELRYFTSQFWPFPHQLMLGFFAEYRGGDLQPDAEEILEARWFEPDDLPAIPPDFTISGQLIQHFLQTLKQ